MSELSKLVGEGKRIKLGEVELEIKPLTVNSLPIMMQMDQEDKSKQAEAMKELISRTLKNAVPDATDEEIDNMSIAYMTPLMEAIMEVNKIEDIKSGEKELLKRLKK